MSKKNYRRDTDNPRYQFEDEFEDYGYDVKNIRRQTKKKVAKFKRETDYYEDSFWTVHWTPQTTSSRVLYRGRQEFFTLTITERNQKLYELRERLLKKRTELAWIEQEIMCVRQQYKDSQMGDLFEEMFGTVWEVAHRGL